MLLGRGGGGREIELLAKEPVSWVVRRSLDRRDGQNFGLREQ